jgi:hypothetical protein
VNEEEIQMTKSIAMGLALVAGASLSSATTFTLNPTGDDRLLQTSAGANDNSEGLSVFNASGNEQRNVLQFDYSSLAGFTVTSATLSLFGRSFENSTAQTSVDFYRVASPWIETQVSWTARVSGTNWANLGGDALGTTGSQLSNPYTHWVGNGTATLTTFNFDVTSLVSGAVNGDFTNNGIMMTGAVGNQLSFVSREGHDFGFGAAANVPVLTIQAVAAPEPSAVGGLVLGISAVVLRKKPSKKR